MQLRVLLFSFLSVLCLYEITLRLVGPQIDIGQDTFTTNAIRLESYVDEGGSAQTVIVGTSLSAAIPLDAWPQGSKVLYQNGGSALTGLDVVAVTSPLPRRILIESNYFGFAPNESSIANATNYMQRRIRSAFWFTRQAYRPMNIMVWMLRRFQPPAAVYAVPLAYSLDVLASQQKAFALPPDAISKSRVEQARPIIDRLEQAGVKVTFFELPVEGILENTPFVEEMRREMEAVFPKAKFCWLSVDDGSEWHTVDGIHLLAADARRAAANMIASRCSNSDK